ncbi:MAG TPA: META domain-containing protein [Candidatus Acidoferrum sp.]|nr:META domain-containing protein [Candidatus Acidoferrum sp.]
MKFHSLCVFASLLVFQLHSCASSNKPAAGTPKAATTISLIGTDWVLTDLAGTPALPGGKATLSFLEAGRVAGNGSCNRFTGAATINGDALKIGPLASTRMACVDADVSKQEDAYLKALGAASRSAYQDPYLLIYCDGYDKPLRFTRAPATHP